MAKAPPSSDDRAFGPKGVEDMITLDNLTEETMLRNIQIRYNQNLIYTFTGSILVSMNPYQLLPIYTPETVKKYIGQRLGLQPPHIFATADDAYRLMRDTTRNQSVIISGESGAGKTEATKLILQYLAAMTNKRSEIEQMILQSSPILEAFGNAKTVRNNNSSRFGKLIEIGFDQNGYICGAKITQYLLERTRIVQQAATERNYHIFYQFLAGATDHEKTRYKIGDPKNFRYLNQSGCVAIDGVDDEALYNKTKNAMTYLGISEGTQDTVFGVLASVLHIGNIEFSAAGDGSKVKNEDVLATAAGLLGIDAPSLGKCLTSRSITVRGTTTTINLNVQQAQDARDAFAKAVYARLFEWLVLRINAAVNKPGIKSFIAVLDIFGFENFKKNSFEQLCINYTNEKLQLHFNEHIFKIEQEEYAREKINWSRVDFKDNLECINLIEKSSPPGLLSLLDEETKFPKATDATFLEKITAQHGKHNYFERSKTMRTSFAVKHYAGDVAYEVEGFLDKNRDTLPADLLALVNGSKTKLVGEIFSVMAAADAAEGAKKIVTVGGNFKNQLIALITTLSATNTHYVRCIKPNTLQKPSLFDADLVLAQLRYAGMLETVRIRKSGYPVRFALKDFVRRYAICVSGLGKYKDDREHASAVLAGLNMDKTTWQLGITKVFLRDYQYAALEDKRNERIKKQIIKIQAWWRMMQVRLFYLQVKGAAIIIQANVKRYLYRKRYLRLRSFTVTAQSVTRFVCVYKKTQARLNAKREEIRRRIAEQKKREAEEAEKRAKEAAKAEAERAKAEEKRRKEEEKQLEKDAKKGGGKLLPGVPGAGAVSDPLGGPPMGEAPPPPGITVTAPSSSSSSATAAPSKQGSTLIEFAKAANKDKWKPFREVDGLQDPPSIVTEENIVAFPFMEYANKHFRKPNQQPKKAGTLHTMKSALEGTLKRKGGTGVGLSFNEMISYQKKPIDFSLLNLDARLSKLAVEVFTNITNYMHPPEKKAPDPISLVIPIIRAGLQNEQLRDEIYCQLYKQTFVVQFQKPPPKEIVMRGWELIMYVTGSFLPSEELTKYFAAYLLGSRNLEGLAATATFCLRRLERAWLRYSYRGVYRSHPASAAELNAVRTRSPIVATIYLSDGMMKYDVELDSAASANECVSMLAKRLQLQDPSFFAVYETYAQDTPQGRTSIERSLFVEEIVADIMAKASFITNFQFKLVFKRKTYINPRQLPEDPVERNLLYMQACEELASDLLHCTDTDAIKLVALRCQCDLGDYTAPSMYTAKVLEQFLPKSLMKKRGGEALRGLIAVEHELMRGTTKEEAKLQYIQYASQLLFYGSTLFPVDNNDDKTLPPKLDVMVNVEGLHFVKTEDDKKKVVQTFWFTDITVQYGIDGVTIITETKGNKEFKTKRGPEIYNLFSDYYFWLNAQSEWCRAKEDCAVDDANVLQFKKGDIIHVIEKEDPEWYVGETLDRTRRGSFPSKSVVMLLKPPVELQTKIESKPKPKMPRASMMVADANKRRVSAMVRASIRYDDHGSSRLSQRNSTDPRASSQMLMNAAKGKQADAGKAKWAAIAVEPSSFKWDTFVTQNFRKTFDKTKKLKSGQIEAGAFTKDPVKESLLDVDATLGKLAVEMFKSVMKYMDDLPKAKASDLEMVQFLCAQVIQNPTLKDEVFAAVIKQITANPKLESLGKGWGLLAVLCGSFFPTERLFPYLVAFCIENTKQGGLYTEIANLAKDCLELLTRQKQNLNYQRSLPPSRQELDAVTGGAQLACLIYFEDKTSKTIDIDSVSTAQEVVDQLGDLRKLRGWYLFEVIQASNLYTEHILKPETAICDVMSKWDKFTIPKGVEGDVDFQFVFKKYVFLKIDQNTEFAHAAAANLFFYQLVNGVHRGRTPVTEEEAVFLAGLQLQYEFGDYDTNKKLEDIIGNYLPRYFAKEQLKKGETQQGKFDKSATIKGGTLAAVAQKVKVVWANFQGMSKKQVLQKYTTKLQENPLYGAMLFPVLYAITRKNIKQCLLAINEEGISVWEPGTKAPLKRMNFGDICSYGPKKGSISLTHGSLVDPIVDTFQTDESFEIADVIKSYQTASKSVAIAVRKALF